MGHADGVVLSVRKACSVGFYKPVGKDKILRQLKETTVSDKKKKETTVSKEARS